MNKEYIQILDLKNRFIGANRGFEFLDSFLNNLKIINQQNKQGKNLIKIYDYRQNSTFDLRIDHEVLYNLLQNYYIEFLFEKKFINYSWYKDFRKNIYLIFSKDFSKSDVFCDVIIKIFLQAFIFFGNFNNIIDLNSFKEFIVDSFVNLTNDFVESNNYTEFIIKNLIYNNLLSINENEKSISIQDKFIYNDFWVTSLNVAPFFVRNEYDLIFSCKYGFETLLPVIDHYLSSFIYTDFYVQSKELFSMNTEYKECFPFLMNYDDDDIFKIPFLEKPYDQLFDSFFLKKLILNEYCFHVIIMSCFQNYIFSRKVKNILMDKADPRLNLRFEDDVINILIK